MRTDEQRDLVRRFYEEMWNRFDTSIFDELLAPSIRFRGSLGHERVGFDELADYVELVRAFAPDFNNEVVQTVSEGRRTCAQLRYTGTHLGELFGIAPTARRFEYSGAALFSFGDRRIEQVWVLGDLHGLLEQLR